MRSVMLHSFSQVPNAEIPRSSFSRNHGYKTTFDAGYLIPVFADIAYPGDTFNCHMTFMARLATPIAPIMDNMYIDSFFFAVPIRLLWHNWERFNGAQDNPGDSTDFLVPQMISPASTGYAVGSLSDYLGIPTGIPGISHSSLWHRAANLIWNQWFRDQNLQDSVVVDLDDGPDDPADYVLLKRGKRHDYFTSCIPFPQKGEDVLIPLGESAPVLGIGKAVNGNFSNAGVTVRESGQTATKIYANTSIAEGYSSGGDNHYWVIEGTNATNGYPNIRADLSEATAATINTLREAFQVQRLYERDSRSGSRYVEQIRSHFGVTCPDFRVARSEYLGGGSSPVIVSPIAQTSSSDATTPQGNLTGMGVSHGSGHGFVKSFTEHCIVIGFVSARADLTYQQGLDRMFSARSRFDFYWPSLARLGEQAVLNKEIYAQGTSADNDVFGYQERYAEMRYKNSRITGKFRSTCSTPLDHWHLSQEFSSLPALNSSFIEENPPMSRIIAVNTEPHFIFDSFFDFKAARPMPLFGVPGMIDHF